MQTAQTSISSRKSEFVIPATDDYQLHATRIQPQGEPAATVLINSAVGVRQSYYRRFAQFLASNNFEVVTYDYRGIGASAPAQLRGFQARMRDWGLYDYPAALDWAIREASSRPIFVIGHSVGGQIFGLSPNAHQVKAFIPVCAQHTWWRLWPLRRQPGLLFLWNVLIPSLSHSMGYFPSSKFGLGENLPKGVALEWAAWAKSPKHVMSAIGEHVRPGYAEYKGHILAFSFEDDSFAPRYAVERLLDVFASAQKSLRHIQPSELGRPVGHFGFFREEFRPSLWQETADWLASHLPQNCV